MHCNFAAWKQCINESRTQTDCGIQHSHLLSKTAITQVHLCFLLPALCFFHPQSMSWWIQATSIVLGLIKFTNQPIHHKKVHLSACGGFAEPKPRMLWSSWIPQYVSLVITYDHLWISSFEPQIRHFDRSSKDRECQVCCGVSGFGFVLIMDMMGSRNFDYLTEIWCVHETSTSRLMGSGGVPK